MKTVTCLAMLLVLFFSACEGPEGPAGPVGPEGPRGSANVSSTTITINSSQFSGSIPQYSVSMPSITQNVFNSGVVMAYVNADGRWLALPWSVHVDGGSSTLGYAYSPGSFTFQVFTNIPGAQVVYDGFQVRVVVIPPVAAKHMPDLSDYEAVARAYHLPW